ncbi:unnamed protein product [Arctogadus glacialis]
MRSVLSQYESVLTATEEMSQSTTMEMSARASGLHKSFLRGNAILGIILAEDVMAVMEELNISLQQRSQTTSGMLAAVDHVKRGIQAKRSEVHFDWLYSKASQIVTSLNLQPIKMPHVRKPPKRFTEDSFTAEGPTDSAAVSRINVALSGTAIQSTTNWSGVAERAIDGNSDPEYKHNSCTHTNSTAKPWWRLELPGVYRVSEIQVTNRNIARERLNGVEVLIGNSMANTIQDAYLQLGLASDAYLQLGLASDAYLQLGCAIINDDPGCLTQTVKCLGMEGKFINFYRSSEIILALQLCEVKVYGGRHPVHHDMIV